jgi:hypothetical protein
MNATLPVPRSIPPLQAASAAVVRAARWLIPDRRDGVVVLALFFGVWMSNVFGVLHVIGSATSASALRFAVLNLANEAEYTLFVVLMARLTVGWSARGWRRHALVALTMAAALSAQAVIHHRIPVLSSFTDVGFGFENLSIAAAVAAVWFPLGLLLAAQFHRSHLEREAAARLRGLLKEVRGAQQRHSEARLRMLQSRIDPGLLFGVLERVQALYETAPERAEMLLEELIVFLRAVLPKLQRAASTVGEEVGVAEAYVRLRALADDQATAFDIDAAAAADAPFPPGVLLPLVGSLLQGRAGSTSLGVRVEVDGGLCELTLTSDAAPPEATLAQARRVLADLYDGDAALELDRVAGRPAVRIRIPHEAAGLSRSDERVAQVQREEPSASLVGARPASVSARELR